MNTTVINLEGVKSVLAPIGVEKQMCQHAGIHKVKTNFMCGTATVYHDNSVTLAEIKQCVADCGYHCTGESLPEHLTKPNDPPIAAMTSHAGHAMPIPAAPRAKYNAHDMRAHSDHAIPVAADESA